MEQQQEQQSVQTFRIEEPIYKLTTKLMKTCNPKTLDKQYLKEFKIKTNETLITLNNTNLDPQSPKTQKAFLDCNLHPNQLILQDKLNFKINGETQELADKRYWLHYFQIAQLKKQVILQRNKYKKEEWIEKYQRPKSIQTLDQSMSSSINISEYQPYKSPTEMIENWIDNQLQSQDVQLQKFNKIQQKRKEQEEQNEQEQIKYKEKLDAILEKKTENRLKNLKQKSLTARKDVSKSLEISTKMKTVISEANIKNAEKKKQQTEQNIEKAQKRVNQIKQTYVDVLEQKQRIYEEKLQQVLKKKDEQDQQLMQSRLKEIQTDRNSLNKNNKSFKQQSSDEWSKKLPILISRSEAQFTNIYNQNLESVIKKFKKEEYNKNKKQKSFEQEKEHLEEIKQKEEQFQKRYSQKLKLFEDQRQKIEEKFAKKDQYLIEHEQKKKQELDEKFDKIRELSADNERRFGYIKQEYNNKCDNQMNKEIKKFKQNMSLIKQREQIIEQLRHKRFQEKIKTQVSLQDSISKQSESKLQQ